MSQPPLRVRIQRFLPYFLFAPALSYIMALVGFPLIQAVQLAFTDPKTGSFSWINFETLFNDPYFWDAIKNTFLLAAIVIPIQVFLAVVIALLINTRFKGHNALLYIVALPLTISDVAAGLIWYSILAPRGFLNKFLVNMHIISRPIYFFGYAFKHMELIAIVLTEIWRATAIVFVIIFAGLQMISKDYIEAAEVFGATFTQRLRYIILPLLKPSLQAALIIRTLFALQVFAVVWILAGRDIPVLAGEAYYWQTEVRNYHVASAYAIIIALISIIISFIYITTLKPHYAERR